MAPERVVYVSGTIFQSVQPILKLASFCGLCPVKYRVRGHGYLVHYSKNAAIWSWALVLTLVLFTILGVVNDLNLDSQWSIRMTTTNNRYISTSDITIVIVMVLLGVVLTPFRIDHLWKSFDCLHQIDRFLRVPERVVKKPKRKKLAYLIFIFSAFSILMFFDVLQRIHTRYRSSRTITILLTNYLSYYAMYYIVIVQEIYYWTVIKLLEKRIYGLNKFLQERCKNLSRTSLLARQWLSTPNNFNNNNSRNNNKCKTLRMSLSEALDLTRTHQLICDCSDSIMKLWGINILLIVLSCVLHLIVTPYFLVMEMKSRCDYTEITLQILWIVTHTSRMILIVDPCHSCIDENKKTLSSVFRLLTFGQQEEAKPQLAILVQQISCRPLNFSACGLIHIDRTLLTAVAGSVTTYLVIVFQFVGK